MKNIKTFDQFINESGEYHPKIHSGMSKIDKLELKLNELLPEQGWRVTSNGILSIYDNEEEILKKLYDHGIKYTKLKDHEGCYQLIVEGFLGFGKKKLTKVTGGLEVFNILNKLGEYSNYEKDKKKAEEKYNVTFSKKDWMSAAYKMIIALRN